MGMGWMGMPIAIVTYGDEWLCASVWKKFYECRNVYDKVYMANIKYGNIVANCATKQKW